MITKEDILSSKENNNVFFSKNSIDLKITWDTINDIFDKAYELNKVRMVSFANFTIDNSENYSNVYDNLIKHLSSIHPGHKIAVMIICNFFTNYDNVLPNNALQLKEKFTSLNQEKIPNPPPVLTPTIHTDDVDGFFVQLDGSTKWMIYAKNQTDEYILNKGDLLYIPKNLSHSVESLCPRHSISISFSDNK